MKACIAKLTKRYDFPDKRMVGRDGAYTHNLTQLLSLAKLEPAIETEFQRDLEFRLNWYVVKEWASKSRAPMDKTTLVEPYIEEGRRFLKLLGVAGVRVNAALWQKDELSSPSGNF